MMIAGFLEENLRDLKKGADCLERILKQLQYEGRPHVKKSARESCTALEDLERSMKCYFQAEEEVLFPYLRMHIPKLEPVMAILNGDHDNCRRTLKNFLALLSDLTGDLEPEEQALLIGKAVSTGTYLFYLLKDRILTNQAGMCRSVEDDLHDDEKEDLMKRIGKWQEGVR